MKRRVGDERVREGPGEDAAGELCGPWSRLTRDGTEGAMSGGGEPLGNKVAWSRGKMVYTMVCRYSTMFDYFNDNWNDV